jgi:hypothetical protein
MPPRRRGTGYINPAAFYAANVGGGERLAARLGERARSEAGELGGTVGELEQGFQQRLRATSPAAMYTGPTSLAEMDPERYMQAAGQQRRLGETLGALGSESGRSRLLQEAYGGQGGYGAAQAAWDAALAGRVGGGFGGLRRALGGDALEAAQGRMTSTLRERRPRQTFEPGTASPIRGPAPAQEPLGPGREDIRLGRAERGMARRRYLRGGTF